MPGIQLLSTFGYHPNDLSVNQVVKGEEELSSEKPVVIPSDTFYCPHRVASSAELFFEQGSFCVRIDGKIHHIHKRDVRGLPSSLKTEQLLRILQQQQGYVTLQKIGADYGLTAHMRLLGGGKGDRCKIAEAQSEFRRRIEQLRHSPAARMQGGIGGQVWEAGYKRIRDEVIAKYKIHPAFI